MKSDVLSDICRFDEANMSLSPECKAPDVIIDGAGGWGSAREGRGLNWGAGRRGMITDMLSGTCRSADARMSLSPKSQAPEVIVLTCLPAMDCFFSVFLL
jgi:hypothetical protein